MNIYGRNSRRSHSLRLVALALASTVAVGAGSITAAGAWQSTPTVLGQAVTDAAQCPGQTTTTYDAQADPYSLYNEVRSVGADAFYRRGIFGQSAKGKAPIDIAMIDSGVAPVPGLDSSNVIDGPDLSFDSQAGYAAGTGNANPDLTHNDGYGHGTHLAGIMVGHDDASGSTLKGHTPYSWSDAGQFTGVAPGARVVSVKVADGEGAVDVTQVIAGIDWVVQHRNDLGMHIRVINLSYGVDPDDLAGSDPLTYAVHQAWNAGIVVVAAAGNAGFRGAHSRLASPAWDPRVIAVGAYDNMATPTDHSDDYATDFSISGTDARQADVLAPGAHVMSLHVGNSDADAKVTADCQLAIAANTPWHSPVFGPDGRFIRGSGTSQAAAIVSGGIALLLAQRPDLTPDQVKAILVGTTVDAGSSPAPNGELALGNAVRQQTVPPLAIKNVTIKGGGSLNDEPRRRPAAVHDDRSRCSRFGARCRKRCGRAGSAATSPTQALSAGALESADGTRRARNAVRLGRARPARDDQPEDRQVPRLEEHALDQDDGRRDVERRVVDREAILGSRRPDVGRAGVRDRPRGPAPTFSDITGRVTTGPDTTGRATTGPTTTGKPARGSGTSGPTVRGPTTAGRRR